MVKTRNWILFGLFAFTLILLRLPSFALPLDTDSSANAFFARQMLRGEMLYGRFHPAHHLPGAYYTFELAFRFFGDHPNSPKFLLLPWAFACVLLIYLMGRSFFNQQTGILGAIFFMLITSQRWVAGQTVEMEHFANLPLIAGAFLSILLLRQRAATWQFVFVGIFGAISILYKITFVASLVVAGTAILLMAWVARREPGAGKAMLSRLVWMAIGLIFPLAMVAAYFASQGLWERFLLVFRFGFGYINDAQLMGGSDLPRPFGFPLFWMSVNNIALLFFGLMGTYRLIRRSIPLKNMDHLTNFVVAFWLVLSFALAGMRGGGFAHYVLPLTAPLALVAAFEINSAYQGWQETSVKKYALLGAMICTALIVINFLWSNYGLYSQYISYSLGINSRESFIRNVDPDGYASQKITGYLQSHTTPDDLIYIWSIHVEPYYYADRLPPVEILWPSYVGATGSPNLIFNPHTKYIVLDSPKRWPREEWLMDGLAADYDLETTIEGREIYRRRSKVVFHD